MKRSVATSGFATNDFNFGVNRSYCKQVVAVNNQTFFNLSVSTHTAGRGDERPCRRMGKE